MFLFMKNIEKVSLHLGYKTDNEQLHCLYCDLTLSVHEIFSIDGRFFDATYKMQQHINEVHGGNFEMLLQRPKKDIGLSDIQVEMLRYFYEGLSDEEIVEKSDTISSVSTVRQHRFKMRERERQAHYYLALMELLKTPHPYSVHEGAKQVAERYAITNDERQKVLSNYFKEGLDGAIETIPSKEKRKIIILQHIITRFEAEKSYTEAQVNAILKGVHEDYVSLRRYLIEYGFMTRSDDGSHYELTAHS